MDAAGDVASHYSTGRLLSAIESGLAEMGTSLRAASIAELAPVDEFHIGGREATVGLCQQLGVKPESAVLDVGSGIGGTARFIASTFGCPVTGIDLTPEYVDVARAIGAATGGDQQVTFEAGTALDMPFDDAAFDIATQLHVGMNIDDKARLFAEVHRVLRPGARYGIYDIMRVTGEAHGFPVPWASSEETSFTATLAEYERKLIAAGFRIVGRRERSQFAKDFFALARINSGAAAGPPPIGLHLIMGADASTKIANMVAAVTAGTLGPTEIICERME